MLNHRNPFIRKIWTLMLITLIIFIGYSTRASQAASITLLGNTSILTQPDSNPAGMAEAFQFTGIENGTVNKQFIYVDSGSNSKNVVAGIYSNNANNTSSYIPTRTGDINSRRPQHSTPTRTPTATINATPGPTLIPTATITPTFAIPPIPTFTPTIPPNGTPGPVTPIAFTAGLGAVDVIPHQIVRAGNDRLYLFTIKGNRSAVIKSYWSLNPGLPGGSSDFQPGPELLEPSTIISVDTAYDGLNTIHVFSNLANGTLLDHPFDIPTRSYRPVITLAPNGALSNPASAATSTDIGTSGISSMFNRAGLLNLFYWSAGNRITYIAGRYDPLTNTFNQQFGPTLVDTLGTNNNHPVVAVSPLDDSLTVAWVSGMDGAGKIYGRTRSTGGVWSNAELISNSDVWTSPANGLNIDQGPSLVIDSAGIKHLAYIENTQAAYDYGHVHYVRNAGAGWVDTFVGFYSHDPALAIDSSGNLYLLGHGYWRNNTCLSINEICFSQRAANGTWSPFQLFASPPNGFSFDASISVKWSVVGWNRPEIIEFLFFSTPYDSPILYYGRIGFASAGATATPTIPPTPTITPIISKTPTITPQLATATFTPTSTPTSAAGGFPLTSVLDTFNRPNGVLGSNWNGTVSGYSVSSNLLDAGSGDPIFWSASSFGPNQEVFVTFNSPDINGIEQDLILKSQSASNWGSGLIEAIYESGNHRVQVWTFSASQGWIQRGADIPVTFVNGDQFGARARSNGSVEVYKNGSLIGIRDCSAWPYAGSGGYIGLWFLNSSNALLDNFGGGTLP